MRRIECLPVFIVMLFLAVTCRLSAQEAYNDSILVIPQNKPLPVNARKIGEIKIGNNSTQLHCDYESMIQQAKKKARKIGGNVVKITRLISPAFISSCYRMQADVLYTDSLALYKAANRVTKQMINNNSQFIDTMLCALLYIYRLPDTEMFSPAYSLHMDKDSVICEIRNKTWRLIKLYKSGKTEFWAGSTNRRSIVLDIQPGKSYYLRCGTEMGETARIPLLELVDNKIGKREYDKLSHKKREMNKSYLEQFH